MAKAYSLTAESEQKLKEPFGILLQGSFLETAKQLKEIIEKEKPLGIISVGDIVSRNLHENNIVPDIAIIDNRNMRMQIQPQTFKDKITVRVKNPRGTITQEAIRAIIDALQNKEPVQIIVEGEEDLLALIAVIYAPINSLIVYGQPKMGMVAVSVTSGKKADAQMILKTMKQVTKNK